jgi:hypothetical protein
MPRKPRPKDPEAEAASRNGRPVQMLVQSEARERAARRTAAFQEALNRKGMPMTWGTGVLRTDPAFKVDMEFMIEDGLFDEKGKFIGGPKKK